MMKQTNVSGEGPSVKRSWLIYLRYIMYGSTTSLTSRVSKS